MTLLFLDDLRNPNTGNFIPEGYSFTNIVWVRNYDRFCKWITDNGIPEAVSFDHDLGTDVQLERMATGISKTQAKKLKRGTKNGMDCAKFLVNYCMGKDAGLPLYFSHSQNSWGKANILGLLDSYTKFRKEQVNTR